jgi:4-hydroxyproline epimerase
MLRVIDSHTAGQPTRVIVEGAPDLGAGTVAERAERFRSNFDHFRSAVVNEPRGTDALVGALLLPPTDPANTTGVIFFDQAGYPPMSGHGMIGLIASLEYLGRIRGSRSHVVETPAGLVRTEVHPSGEISFENVSSFRHAKDVKVDQFTGEIAWGGNWYFLTDHDLTMTNPDILTEVARSIRKALARDGITVPGGKPIMNIALFGPASRRGVNSRNFVLRASGAYDRSPSGTATSAKLACLYEDGLFTEGQTWRQESIAGTVFDAYVTVSDGMLRPTIRSNSFITAEAMLIVDERDPFCWGM